LRGFAVASVRGFLHFFQKGKPKFIPRVQTTSIPHGKQLSATHETQKKVQNSKEGRMGLSRVLSLIRHWNRKIRKRGDEKRTLRLKGRKTLAYSSSFFEDTGANEGM
jgi:hypothetical protein